MKLIIIDRKAWERHRSEFADFIHRVEKLIGNPPKTEQWLDNEAVCKRWASASVPYNHTEIRAKSLSPWLDISVIYKQTDICEMLNAVKDWNQRMNELWQRMKSLRGKTLRCSCFHNWWRHFEEVGAVLLYRPSDAWMVEVYLSGEEVCSQLRLSTRTLQSTETQERFLSTKSEGRYSTSRATYKPCLKNTITRYPRIMARIDEKRKQRLEQGH